MTLAVLCPGQGAQHPAMLDLVAGDPAAEEVLMQGARATGTHVRDWLADPETIDTNAIAQPLLCLVELATWAALREKVAQPLAFAGYSIGELASYACAGALQAEDLARLAVTRASLMDEASNEPGGLMAVRGLARKDTQALCAEHAVWIAIATGVDAFVVGGASGLLDALAQRAQTGGAQITCLKVGVPAHTPLLRAAVSPFRDVLDASSLRAPEVPVVAGIDGSLVTTRARAISTLSLQIASTIEWSRVLQTLYERGARVFLELGPGRALSRMVRDQLPQDAQARSVSEFRSIGGVVQWVQRGAS